MKKNKTHTIGKVRVVVYLLLILFEALKLWLSFHCLASQRSGLTTLSKDIKIMNP